jgi:hypothetical protein
MFISKVSLPRRTFLRGLGATLALPLLDAMVPAATALAQTAASRPSRFGFIYVPHGADMASWTPAAAGADFELSPTLKPLEAFKSQMVVISNLKRAGGQAEMHAGLQLRLSRCDCVGIADTAAADGDQPAWCLRAVVRRWRQ